MIYALLGELEFRHEGRPLALPTGHTLTLFTALLLNANRQVSKEDLLRAVWGDTSAGVAQLHKHAGLLRAMLAKIGRRDDIVTRHGFGYELRVAETDMDLLMFERLVRTAEKAQEERRVDDEVRDLRRALRLWRGHQPLSNVAHAPFDNDVLQLKQRRKRSAVRLFTLELARGKHEEVVDGLLPMAAHDPTDHRLHELLIIALYRSGHAMDATHAYERHQAALADKTGGTPDAALRALHYAIARGEDTAVTARENAIIERAGLGGIAGGRPAAATVPRQLPPDPSDLVGRDDLVAEATWLLGREPQFAAPVVIVTGPGGIGKTAFALRVAHLSSGHYPDGQLYAELRDAAGQPVDTSEVLAQFLRALQVPSVPDSKAERLSEFRTLLSDRRVLVVLDDAGDGAQVRDLIPAHPGCGVLVTSQQRLPELPGVHHVPPLEPLPSDKAVELFLGVVRGAGIDLGREMAAVEQVVALCDGLPLALRIAGAIRVRDHPRPTAELAHRLARQGAEGFVFHDLNVTRTIGAGFDRLDENARQLFLGLGLARLPRIALWTAAALQGDNDEPGAALSALASSSMLDVLAGDVRYRLHELTRDYALRRALSAYPDAGDRLARRGRVYQALLTLTRRAHAALYGGGFEVVHSDVPDWDAPDEACAEVDVAPLAWFEKERLNIRAAVDHCAELGLTDICWDLAVSAHEFYTIGDYFDDWYATHVVALSACRDAANRRGEGVLIACLGQPVLVASRRADALPDVAELRRAVDLLTECGDLHGQAIALRTLANALRRRGHLTEPLALFTTALGLYEKSGDLVGSWQAMRFIGQTYLDLGRHDEALTALRGAREAARGLGDDRLLAQTSYWLGQTCLAAGDLREAEDAFTAMLDVYTEPGGVGHAYAMQGRAEVASRSGRLTEAERYLAQASGGCVTDALLAGRVRVSAAALRADRGDHVGQAEELNAAIAAFAGCGAVHLEAAALHTLGVTLAGLDERGSAAAFARIEELYAATDVPDFDRVLDTRGA